MPVENSTPNRGYQLPDGSNNLEDDVLRLIAALSAIDLDIAGLLVSVAQRALLVHSHVIADTTGLQAALDSKQDGSEKGNANGYASLDATGKVPAAQLPAALFGAMSYQGTWNAITNSPTIPAASSANKGQYYKVDTPGATNVSGITDWKVGDWIVSNGTSWDKIDNTDQVSSVAGKSGAVTLQVADIIDMSASGRSLVQAASNAAMKALLAVTAADITDASANARSLITAADYSAMRTLLGLVIGTHVQAYSAVLAGTTASFTTALLAKLNGLPGTVDYGAGNAGLTYGAVGTYVFGYSLNGTGIVDGSTYAGSAIQPSGVSENSSTDATDDTVFGSGSMTGVKGGAALSGTWRAMGRVNNSAGSNRRRQTLFLRIS
ncbi:hypothetical protein [Mesorhizobium sp. AA23]|uniref:hypothetical protein n=1 Tax=Mesorhizobium sp. AA23 TaxID=1854058 RepID=UPI0007FD1528|nr:hypothetical protein [Mesorhizobium sp. AA23]OBQ91418.1 hypothetical protein A9K66_13420 [Mesorhizobium sp. AA23]